MRFDVGDVQAVLVKTCFGAGARLAGGRCNERPVTFDAEGRAVDDECRATNAGAFHVVLGNPLGLPATPSAADSSPVHRDFNDDVIGYEVEDAAPISEEAAGALVGGEGAEHPYDDEATSFLHVRTRVDYLPEHSAAPNAVPATDRVESLLRHDTYEYVLELSSWGEVLGGEWIGGSDVAHPDFLWLPTGHEGPGGEEGDGDNPHIRWDHVQLLARLSRQ